MDITSEDFVNKNLYEFCHAEDLQKLHKAHVDCKYMYEYERRVAKTCDAFCDSCICLRNIQNTVYPINGGIQQ